MLTYSLQLPIYEILISLGEAMDLVSPRLINHHKQVSYLSYAIGREMGLPTEDIQDLATAGALHDIGGLTQAERLETLKFEMDNPDRHSVGGFLLLGDFKPFTKIASLVRHHHVFWQYGEGKEHLGEEVLSTAHILHLADRIAVSIDPNREILSQSKDIVADIGKNSGRMFVPEQVEAFRQLAERESFWFDATSPDICRNMNDKYVYGSIELDEGGLLGLAALFSRVIDFRSHFTATHSSGVAAVAKALVEMAGLDRPRGTEIKIAGLLHDIGKLAVPTELLEKTAPLTREDSIIIHKHPYLSRHILNTTEGFDEISLWAAYHHERLDGSGYPFHRQGEEIPLGARILSVVDVFTALTEKRPYRSGMSMRGTLQILESLAGYNRLDPGLVSLFRENMGEFNKIRIEAQQAADENHQRFNTILDQLAPVSIS